MNRYVASLALLFLTSASLFAQKASDPILLTVRPAELPPPSLKYRLTPDRGQLTDGNAPTQYYRTLSLFMENPGLLAELRQEYWDNWLTMPLKDLPRKDVEEKVHMARHVIRELELGSKRKRCDWQLEGRPEGLGVAGPEVQGLRLLVRPLAVRARLAIANGHYAEACESLQIGYALAHHLGQGPTRVHLFGSKEIAHLMTTQLETLLQQPDAPNLYWALAAIPRPFADLKPALRDESLWLEKRFPWLKKLDEAPLSETHIKAIHVEIEQSLKEFNLSSADAAYRTFQAVALAQATAEGKRELVSHYQFTNEQVAAMPSFQVAVLYAFRDYKEAFEELVKWADVPEGWKYPAYKAAQAHYDKALRRLDLLCFRKLIHATLGIQPTLEKLSLETVRVDRRLAALRCVEALRQYAAKHEGKLPAALADVKELPIPSDPLTGKPFEYAMDGDKATLMLAKPAEEKPNPNELLKYYLTMKRGKE